MYEPVCRLKASVKTLLNEFFLSVSLWPFFAVTFFGLTLFSLLRYSRILMSHFDILIYFISKTFLVTNEMIESDQNLQTNTKSINKVAESEIATSRSPRRVKMECWRLKFQNVSDFPSKSSIIHGKKNN